mmetsp:Transcript_26371/g.40265  ORF Transcript_26371/g.40265 Transcript_26371/m.40265 type:complete len:236 (-) Transcript_26371:863-1570(-)
MPHIIAVLVGVFGVLHASGVSAGNEVRDARVHSGRGVPEDLGGATVVHGGRPHSEDGMLGAESSIVEECLVLAHSVVKGYVVILAPSAERVEEEDGVLEALLQELLAGVLEHEDVTVMEGVADLEGEDGVGVLLLDLLLDLLGGESVLVHTVVEFDVLEESHGLSGDEEVALGHDSLNLGVLHGLSSEDSGRDLLLAVVKEDGLLNNSQDLVGDLGALNRNLLFSLELGLLLSSH